MTPPAVDCGGARLHVEERGAGPALLLVHGFPHDAALWRPQLDGLADVAHVVAPELRGLGRSASGDAPATMDAYADDLACVLDALGIERAVVGGLSMGGYVALAFWRRHPARVRALVLADTRAGADDDAGRATRRELMGLARDAGAAAIADRMLEGMVGRSTRRRLPELVDDVRLMLARQPVDGIVRALQAMHDRPDSGPTLATIDVPTLVLVGDEDAITPPAEARRLHEGIAGSRLAVITGAGHVSTLERAAAANHLLREFLASLGDA